MKQLLNRLYRFSCIFLQLCALLLTGMLSVCSFLFTCYADDMETQKVLTAVDNPLVNIFGVLLFGAALCICSRFVCRNAARRGKILLVLVMGWTALLGAVLILFSRTVPAADAWSVYSAAEALSKGDTSVIHPTASYLSYYPQQVGLMAFFELLIRLLSLTHTGLQPYHFIKCIYVALTCAIIFLQYRSVRLLWKDDRADCVYLILAGANLPLIMYSSFVYGEIPSFAAVSAGFYWLLKLREGKKQYALLSLAALALSVILRKNSLILIIGAVLILLFEYCRTNRRGLPVYCALCTVLALSVLPATQKIYELRSGSYLKSGVPALSYLAMGMQESSRGNGWYNGFNFNTYHDTGMDTEATEERSRKAIEERLEYFRAHPEYAVGFYFNKYLSQWADGTYASRQATLATFGGRHPFFQELYAGRYSGFYIAYCNIFQLVVYLGCFLFFLSLSRKKQSAPLYIYLGIVGVLGGLLFHMAWEANSRYAFPYSLLLMPYAASAIAGISNRFFPEISRKSSTLRTADATEKQATAK